MSGSNKKRKQQFESLISQETNEDILYGLNEGHDYYNDLSKEIYLSKRKIALPISTRAFGLVIENLRSLLQIDPKFNDEYFHALYRFTLMQLEFKLNFARSIYEHVSIDSEQEHIIKCESFQFRSIFDLITSVGSHDCYIPVKPKRKRGIEGLDPCLIFITNLRDYVEWLSDLKTPQTIRKHFYDHKSIPAAIWSEDVNNPILLNADEIMPKEYSSQQLTEDRNIVSKLSNESIVRKFYENRPIEFEERDGKSCQLFSCELQTFQNDSFKNPLEIKLWSPEILKQHNAPNYTNLFGELPNPNSIEDFSIYNIRMRECAKSCIMDHQFSFIPLEVTYKRSPHYELTNRKTITLPISTRGFGFIIKNISLTMFGSTISSKNLEEQKNFERALYRVVLFMLEQKLETIPLDEKYQFTKLPIPLTHMIALIQRYVYGRNINYKLIVPEPIKCGEFAYDPCLITFSNLREYVKALSNPETSALCRKYFYEHSPLPAAEWNNSDPDSPLLNNPDEIMPETYNESDDIFNFIGSRIRKYTSGHYNDNYSDASGEDKDEAEQEKREKEILFEDTVLESHLNGTANIFSPSCKINPIKYENDRVKTDWWSSEEVTKLECFLAFKYLFGEIPRSESVQDFKLYTPRYNNCAIYNISNIPLG